MLVRRICAVVVAGAAFGSVGILAAPAASADTTVRGVSGGDCLTIEDPYVTVTPSITFGAGSVQFGGVSECD